MTGGGLGGRNDGRFGLVVTGAGVGWLVVPFTLGVPVPFELAVAFLASSIFFLRRAISAATTSLHLCPASSSTLTMRPSVPTPMRRPFSLDATMRAISCEP